MDWTKHLVELGGSTKESAAPCDDHRGRRQISLKELKHAHQTLRDCGVEGITLLWSIVRDNGDSISSLD